MLEERLAVVDGRGRGGPSEGKVGGCTVCCGQCGSRQATQRRQAAAQLCSLRVHFRGGIWLDSLWRYQAVLATRTAGRLQHTPSSGSSQPRSVKRQASSPHRTPCRRTRDQSLPDHYRLQHASVLQLCTIPLLLAWQRSCNGHKRDGTQHGGRRRRQRLDRENDKTATCGSGTRTGRPAQESQLKGARRLGSLSAGLGVRRPPANP